MDDFYIRWGRSEYADGDSNGSGKDKDQTHSHSESTEQARRHNLNSNPTHGHSISTDPAPESRKRLSEPALSSKINNSEESSRAILAGCCTDLSPEKHARAMSELRGLAEACGLLVVSVIVQNAPQITHATYIGSGKVIELKHEIEAHDADIVLFNEALTPMQMRNLEKELDTEVLDRTGLILQIFASRARTREAKLQVESARLQYMLPRLIGMRASLSRQGGGSGRLSNKGAGEQKLELDRRRIEKRIAELRRELDIVERERSTQRSRRLRTGLTRVALVGYTNAGKSTVMNALLKESQDKSQDKSKEVLEADMLFATLDTSVRRIEAPGHIPFLLSDTVGFVSDLPHALVKAFRSTLDEVRYADLLLEVVDFSDPDYREQIEVTAKTLEEIGAGHIPVVYLYNKTDLVLTGEGEKSRPIPNDIPFRRGETLYLAAGKGIGIPEILDLIDSALEEDRLECSFHVPYSRAGLLQQMRQFGVFLSEEYLPEGIRVRIRCRREDAHRFRSQLEN